jgi:hypothetical protein
MLITVYVPIGPLLHLGELGLLPASQAAVGSHLGLGGANAGLLIFQAAKFSGSQLARLQALVYPTFLIHFHPVDV